MLQRCQPVRWTVVVTAGARLFRRWFPNPPSRALALASPPRASSTIRKGSPERERRRFPRLSVSRRPDSSRGPLHYKRWSRVASGHQQSRKAASLHGIATAEVAAEDLERQRRRPRVDPVTPRWLTLQSPGMRRSLPDYANAGLGIAPSA